MESGEHFDVIIIGAGPSGIFCAYELIKEKPELNILMIEKGRPIEKRVCPKRKTKVCVGCKPCSITTGFAGAGALSNSKLSPSDGGMSGDLRIQWTETHQGIRRVALCSSALIRTSTALTEQAGIRKIRKKAINANRELIDADPPPRNGGRL